MTNKEAIGWVNHIKNDYIKGGDDGRDAKRKEALDLAIKALEDRPQGKWIKHSTYKDVLICSNCNHGSNQVYDAFNFCPNCGTRMEKEND